MTQQYDFEIEARVLNIPCKIGVFDYDYCEPWKGSAHSCPSDLDYYGYEDFDFELLDQRGRVADWLQAKVDKLSALEQKAVEASIREQVLEHIHKQRREAEEP